MLRILLLCHGFNSLSQRLFVELRALGHDVSVELDINDSITLEAVELFAPDLIIAPYLKRAIPRAVWQRHVCLVVHPGPIGDRGPAALDWAVLGGETEWGVTVLQAVEELDAGPIWAHRKFAMRKGTKSSLYRNEVSQAAASAVLEAVDKFRATDFAPEPLETFADVRPRWRNAVRQSDRTIDWQRDETETVLRKIASADGMPGCRDCLFGQAVFLFDASRASGLASNEPGTVIARSGPAIARATVDGAVWIGRVRLANSKQAIKLPATRVFCEQTQPLPELDGYQEISYEEQAGVGYLYFPFYNGAMGTDACERLLTAYRTAIARPTRVLVLMGGPDFWSNGLDLNLIEAASSAADESWRNINAIDDLTQSIVETTDRLVISAVGGNAGAGGVFLARAGDEVWLRSGVTLNPHYKDMGNLYGSELWTYLLPHHAGDENARRLTEARLPIGASEALELGLADRTFEGNGDQFCATVRALAAELANCDSLIGRIKAKAERRARDEALKSLSAYRSEELLRMKKNFYGFDPSYHIARSNFVHKIPKSRTPITIAKHRDRRLEAAHAGKVAS